MEEFRSLVEHTIIPRFPLLIPPTATEIFYRDEIGNVSTSALGTRASQGTVLELQPRFPLYGGWTYNWHHGYALPGKEYLSFDSTNGVHTLASALIQGIPNVLIENLKWRAVLPEGAVLLAVYEDNKLLKLNQDYAVENTWYYFDTRGRPTVTIERPNVVEEHGRRTIRVEYQLPVWAYFQKSMAILSVVICGAVLVWIWSRLDFDLIKVGRSICHPGDLSVSSHGLQICLISVVVPRICSSPQNFLNIVG
jgi:oligosaccharyltransferase complex subunit alpha (ribophorin I)